MFVCSNCFSDIETKSHIESLAKEKGDCKYCCTMATGLLPIEELLDFFEELFSLYKTDNSGIRLINKIETDWGLFSDLTVSSKLIPDILQKTSFSHWHNDTEVEYIDEITENVFYWDKLRQSLKWERRFLVELENIKDLEWDKFFRDQIIFNETEKFYRARIHYTEGEKKYIPARMGFPEKKMVYSGRANPQGIPYLYLSKTKLTTLYETRALFHDEVSIGEFRVRAGEELYIVDFTEKGSAFSGIGNLRNHAKAIKLKELIGKDLSKPIRRYDSDIEYIPTQFICEFIKYVIGADGILFNSSLHKGGQNLVLFKDGKVDCIEVKKYILTNISIDFEEVV
jgi:hypothetical protein